MYTNTKRLSPSVISNTKRGSRRLGKKSLCSDVDEGCHHTADHPYIVIYSCVIYIYMFACVDKVLY